MPTIDDAFDALRAERAYQRTMWGDSAHDHAATPVLAFLSLMESYLTEARELQARHAHDADIMRLTGDAIRKVTALGVACMEAHGVVARVPPTTDV
jgi:hypothetical protein